MRKKLNHKQQHAAIIAHADMLIENAEKANTAVENVLECSRCGQPLRNEAIFSVKGGFVGYSCLTENECRQRGVTPPEPHREFVPDDRDDLPFLPQGD